MQADDRELPETVVDQMVEAIADAHCERGCSSVLTDQGMRELRARLLEILAGYRAVELGQLEAAERVLATTNIEYSYLRDENAELRAELTRRSGWRWRLLGR